MNRAALVMAFIGLVPAVGCVRRDSPAAPDSTSVAPPATEPERTAYLSVSDPAPKAGDTIVVAGTVGVGESMSLGSFRVRLAYDTTRLAYVGEVPLPGMMRVMNSRPGEVVVVGASSEPSADGKLFAATFRVVDPRGIESLALAIDELNDGTFMNQMQAVRRSSRILPDRSLTPGRGTPP